MTDTTPPPWTQAWPWSAPRPSGPWTVRCGDRFALVDPETGAVTPLDPASDPDLPGIAPALATGGRLLAYRHRRRAVIAHEQHFTKVVRPARIEDLVRRHRVLSDRPGVTTPTVGRTHPDGRVEIGVVGGTSLHARSRRGVTPPLDRVAAALAAVHEPVDDSLPAATIDDPVRWIDIVARIDPDSARRLEPVAARLPAVDLEPQCVVHTDLHDKNILVADTPTGASVGIIDLDGLSLGPRELDIANLAVHLELRGIQAGTPELGVERSAALLGHYRNHHPLDDELLEGLRRHTWFRLACLYRCRSSDAAHVRALLAGAR